MRAFAKIFAAVGLALLLALPAMAQAQDAPIVRLSGTLAKVHDAGEITLGYRADSFPFSYLDVANNPVGYSLDLCAAVVAAVALGACRREVEHVPMKLGADVPVSQVAR